MSLIVGVDADGVLTDMHSFNLRDGKKYLKKEPVNPDEYYTRDIFNISEKEEFLYGLKGGLNRYCKKEPPMQDSVDVVNNLYKKGVRFHEITARKFATKKNILGKYYRNLFENWLEKHNFSFSSIEYCSEKNSKRDKLLACKKLGVDYMIEDKVDVALYLAQNGVKVLLMDAAYNKKLYHENITRVFNWKEIEKILEEKKSVIENNNKFEKKSKEELQELSVDEKECYFKNYHRYLKKLSINKKEFEKGKRRYKLIYKMSILPVKVIFKPIIRNLNNVPYQDGIIIASNHLSSKDQYLINCAIGNKYYIGFAASTIKNTFRGKLFNFTRGSIFIDRNDSNSKKIGEEEFAKRIANGYNGLIFPEGTRKNKNKDGLDKEQLPFKLGTVSIAQKTGTGILPVSIYYGKSGNYVDFGNLMFVKPNDDLIHSNKQLEKTILEMTRESIKIDKQKIKK